MSAPTREAVEGVLSAIRRHAASWEPDARLFGNVRAADVVAACDALLAPAPSAAEGAEPSDETLWQAVMEAHEAYHRTALKQAAADRIRAVLAEAAGEGEREDAARFRWLCDEKGLGFSYDEKGYGVACSRWGDWPDDMRQAIDAARAAAQPAEREAR